MQFYGTRWVRVASSAAKPAPECRVSGMEAPEIVKDYSDAIGRRQPGEAGYRLNGGKSPTLPCQTLLSSVLSAPKKLTGRRQKTATAIPLKATEIIVTTPNSKATQFRASGPARRGFAVVTPMFAVCARLMFALILLAAIMSVVTN